MKFHLWSKRQTSRTVPPSRPGRFRPSLELLEKRDLLTTFQVTTIGDAGLGSLRQAITDANASSGADRIEFAIGGGGVKTIALNTALPDITDAVTIDGYTQTGATKNTLGDGQGTNANLTVEIKPAAATSITIGLSVHSAASGTVLSGLSLYGFSVIAVNIGSSGVRVAGCFVGTDALTNPRGNYAGIIVSNSTGNTIGGPDRGDRNLISNNQHFGIDLSFDANGNFIQNNLIGTDKTGTAGTGGNAEQGILIQGGNGNTVGGATANLRNIVSGNTANGIEISAGSNNVIQGNYIGVDVSGNKPVGNGKIGLLVNGTNTVVRGNVVGSNGNASNKQTGGIFVGLDQSSLTSGTVVAGNYVGVGADGTTNVGNRNAGVYAGSGAFDNTIGGTLAADRNVISGNAGHGIFVAAGQNVIILGNFIGTNASGVAAAPNTGDGVRLNSLGVTVGGIVSGAGNVISGNGGDGIHTFFSDVEIQGNFIGVGKDGVTKIGNARGIFVDNPVGVEPIQIGGSAAAARNVVSGNTGFGIDIFNAAVGAVLQGNFIGTDATGSLGIGNGANGIQINGGANIQVLNNVISGNGAGVNTGFATDTKLAGNLIGLNALGTVAMPNALYGVQVESGSNTIIGGVTAAERNVISGNVGNGIQVIGGSATILGNFIGLKPSGNATMANIGFGVVIQTNQVTVGGPVAGAGNVISGNSSGGVSVQNVQTPGVAILGNFIGTNAGGTAGPVSGLESRLRQQAGMMAAIVGDAKSAMPELVGLLGDGPFRLPRQEQTHWPTQSPDARFLALPCGNTVVLYEAGTGAVIRILKGHTERTFLGDFSSDSKRFACGSVDGFIRVWDVSSGKEELSFKDGANNVWCTRFSPDGRQLVTGGVEGAVKVWDAANGKGLKTLGEHDGGATCLAFSATGTRLVTAGVDRQVRVWSWPGGDLLKSLEGHPDIIQSVTFSADSSLFASGSQARVTVWDVANFRPRHTLQTAGGGLLGFTPDGLTLVAGPHDLLAGQKRAFTRWDLETGTLSATKEVPGPRNPIVGLLSRDGRTVYLMSYVPPDASLGAYDVQTGADRFLDQGHSGPVSGVAISPDGRTLASGGRDGRVFLWDLASPPGNALAAPRRLAGHDQPVFAVTFSPDGRLLASSSIDGTIRLSNVATGQIVHELGIGLSPTPVPLAFSPDGEILAAGGGDGSVNFWVVETGQPKAPVRWHVGYIRAVAFSPDGRWLASGGLDKSVQLIDRATDLRVHTFRAGALVTCLSFSPDSGTLAAALDGSAPSVRLWDVAARAERTLTGDNGRVLGLAFTPQGDRIATASMDGTARLWDTAGGADRSRVFDFRLTGPAGAVAVSSSGRHLAVGLGNGLIAILRTPPVRAP